MPLRAKEERNRNHLKKMHRIKALITSSRFLRVLIVVLTLLVAFSIIENGATPQKFKLELSKASPYDITAPRQIENIMKTREKAKAASEAVPPVMIRLEQVPISVLTSVYDFFTMLDTVRSDMEKSIQMQGITSKDKDYKKKIELEQALAVNKFEEKVKVYSVTLSEEQMNFLVSKATNEDLAVLKSKIRELVGEAMQKSITAETLSDNIMTLQNSLQSATLSQELKNIGGLFIKAILRANSEVDEELTKKKREEEYAKSLEANRVIIQEGARILSVGDIVTEDKLEMIKELDLLETGRFDFSFAAGLLIVFSLLAFVLMFYLQSLHKKISRNTSEILLLAVIILLVLAAARAVADYSPLLIPVFVGTMLISILLDVKLAVVVNAILTMSLMFITKWDMSFFYMAIISGAMSAYFVSRANQRSRISVSGLLVAAINVIIIASMGVIEKKGLSDIARNSAMVFINGVVSTILTIGILPFFESTFHIITPLKLLELANPNQPLIKRLLIEAPGTYHHSLMVGNLAEVAAEAIHGNALLARVGAYYHDVGKLKRPNFFIENQLSDNPHDRMTANLSTLVITSHTRDGLELAEKYKLPPAIRDIILQHHGNTMVAYFYHKAKKNDKEEATREEDFRYTDPKPSTKEAAVVMLADSVEAAIRSLTEKTEGKIEGLVRKIIKDKLDDGQLDLCELTLKDLDDIARSFVHVFSGYFHEREEYPDLKIKGSTTPTSEVNGRMEENK